MLLVNAWLNRPNNCSSLRPSGDSRIPSVLQWPLLTISDECLFPLPSVYLVTKVPFKFVYCPVGGDLWACSRGPFLGGGSWKQSRERTDRMNTVNRCTSALLTQNKWTETLSSQVEEKRKNSFTVHQRQRPGQEAPSCKSNEDTLDPIYLISALCPILGQSLLGHTTCQRADMENSTESAE